MSSKGMSVRGKKSSVFGFSHEKKQDTAKIDRYLMKQQHWGEGLPGCLLPGTSAVSKRNLSLLQWTQQQTPIIHGK